MNELNEKLIEFTNQLTIADVEFILRVWKDRISIYNANTRQQDIVGDVWMNGTAVELGIPEESKKEAQCPTSHTTNGTSSGKR